MDESRSGSDSWRTARRIFTEARELPEGERAGFIRKECGDDADVLAEVRALLAADVHAEAYFASLVDRLAGTDKDRRPITGRTLGRFQVTDLIGSGGMGDVYRATDLRLGREVALKVLSPELAGDADHVARFRREARIVAALNHPNIASIHDVEEIDGLIVLVLEYVEGQSLSELLQRGALPLGEALEIARQVAGALEAAHEMGIVHRDLKPSNIAITPDGSPFVLDFGIAKHLERPHQRDPLVGQATPTSVLQTRPGTVVGTAAYMSPEQARARPVDERSDIWAFGAVVYEMLAGRRAFDGESLLQVIARVLDSEPEWSALPEDTPLPVRDLLRRCLERDVQRRLQEIRDARIALEAALRGEPHALATVAPASKDELAAVAPAGEAAGRATAARRGFHQRVRSPWGWAALGLPVLAVVALAIRSDEGPTPPTDLWAIGEISDYLGGNDSRAAAALSDMLATNLARVDGVAVLSAARMLEVAPQDLPRRGSLAAAARRAGATTFVEGGLHHASVGGYRLDLRIVRLESGEVLEAFALEGPDLFALADSGTSRIAGQLGGRALPGSIRDVTTSSEVAYLLYREGLRLYFGGRRSAAKAMLDAALREDPEFAMAVYWRSILSESDDLGTSLALLARADALAESAPDRERWLIRARVARLGMDQRLRAYADSLVQRYPEEPDGWELLATALVGDGAYEQALPVLHRVLDELGPDEAPSPAVCRTCAAYALLADTYAHIDSAAARRRTVAAWTRDYPDVPAAWRQLALTLSADGLPDAADAARRRAYDLDQSFEVDRSIRVALALNRGDPEAAVAAARSEADGVPPDWWLTSYAERARGRWAEAMDAALRERAHGGAGALPPGSVHPSALSQAVTLRMSRRPLEAAALFDSLAAWRHETAGPLLADRQRAWMLVQKADALALAGQASELDALADEIERLGARSRQIRDRLMHWHVRGLSRLAQGDTTDALDLFRRSVYSLSHGYTRTNQLWAETLLARGDAQDAIPLLQAALRGSIEGPTFFANPADSHRLLAEAWSRMPGPAAADSARAHREWGR